MNVSESYTRVYRFMPSCAVCALSCAFVIIKTNNIKKNHGIYCRKFDIDLLYIWAKQALQYVLNQSYVPFHIICVTLVFLYEISTNLGSTGEDLGYRSEGEGHLKKVAQPRIKYLTQPPVPGYCLVQGQEMWELSQACSMLLF